MPSLTFIGKPEATETETDLLHTLGRAFAHDDITLITNPAGDSNKAIASGYKDFGKEPVLIQSPLTQPSDGVLIYTDAKLTALLDTHYPDWRASDPTVIQTLEGDHQDFELYEYVMAALAGIGTKALDTPREPT